MQPQPDHELTRLLDEVRQGNTDAQSRLVRLIYPELRRIAQRHMRSERHGHTLQTTALVNEAWLRMGAGDQNWNNRTHFFAAAAQTMRRVLVDYARRHCAMRRGGGGPPVPLDDVPLAADIRSEKLLALDEALSRLSEWQPRQARIVELRFFAGMSEEEVAEILGISARTVKRDWRTARAWLYAEIGDDA